MPRKKVELKISLEKFQEKQKMEEAKEAQEAKGEMKVVFDMNRPQNAAFGENQEGF